MSLVRQPPKLTGLDEDELRAFYTSCGMSAKTIENAIKLRSCPADGQPPAPHRKKHGQQGVKV